MKIGKLDTVPVEHDGAKAVSQLAGVCSGVLGVGGYSHKQTPIKNTIKPQKAGGHKIKTLIIFFLT